jgi:hypothetical protein
MSFGSFFLKKNVEMAVFMINCRLDDESSIRHHAQSISEAHTVWKSFPRYNVARP